MSIKKPVLTLMTLLMVLAMAGNSWADISNAAVLFLRIAPGARAAGMGEAFVAVADDATATHWNPAGLGAYPLSDTWLDAGIPRQYQPLRDIASLKTGDRDNYLGYEIWAITDRDLLRYDNRNWNSGEEFSTKSDETIRQKVTAYFGVIDDEQLDGIIEQVARANSQMSYEKVDSLVQLVRENVPEDYSRIKELNTNLDSMLVMYWEVRLNWDKVRELQKDLVEGLEDSTLTEMEMDRINFAAERARTRFLPESLTIPYGAVLAGSPTAIASAGRGVLVGSDNGLFFFNGRRWQILDEGNGLPSRHVYSLKQLQRGALVGTDKGVVYFNGVGIDSLGSTNELPVGPVTALGAAGMNKIYVIVNGELYRYDGTSWATTYEHTVSIDESFEQLIDKHLLYGNGERAQLEERVLSLNPDLNEGSEIEPGTVVTMPLGLEFRGDIRDIYVGPKNRIWLASDHGIIQFDDDGWKLPGYRNHVVQEGETLASLTEGRRGLYPNQSYMEVVRRINGLGPNEEPQPGTTIKLYQDPRAASAWDIDSYEFRTYVATSAGLLETDGKTWGRSDIQGMGTAHARGVHTNDAEVWFFSDDKVVARARGRSEVAFMHVNWLPELADDLYYEFLGFTTPVEGWGTFGLNATFISYGTFQRTGEDSPDVIGEFDSFDFAITGSYGTSLTNKLKGGVSAKVIHSRLADQGAGAEVGQGTATGFALDFGLLYEMSSRLNLGLAVTNLGPKMSYLDAAQSDDLPRNLAIGFAFKVINSDYNRLLLTAEANKILVGLNDGIGKELEETVFNGGIEWQYMELFAVRAGRIHDQEGDVKVWTLGAGLSPLDFLRVDFAYIPSSKDDALANTLRISAALAL